MIKNTENEDSAAEWVFHLPKSETINTLRDEKMIVIGTDEDGSDVSVSLLGMGNMAIYWASGSWKTVLLEGIAKRLRDAGIPYCSIDGFDSRDAEEMYAVLLGFFASHVGVLLIDETQRVIGSKEHPTPSFALLRHIIKSGRATVIATFQSPGCAYDLGLEKFTTGVVLPSRSSHYVGYPNGFPPYYAVNALEFHKEWILFEFGNPEYRKFSVPEFDISASR